MEGKLWAAMKGARSGRAAATQAGNGRCDLLFLTEDSSSVLSHCRHIRLLAAFIAYKSESHGFGTTAVEKPKNNLKSYDRQANITTTHQGRVPAVRVSKSSGIGFHGSRCHNFYSIDDPPNLEPCIVIDPSQYMQMLL
jgi:hypothetical protein